MLQLPRERPPGTVCTSPQGAGKGSGAKCGNCYGKDHTSAMCPSKGGGKYSPPPPPSKGKGFGNGKVFGRGKGFGKSMQGFSALEDGWAPAEAWPGNQAGRAPQSGPHLLPTERSLPGRHRRLGRRPQLLMLLTHGPSGLQRLQRELPRELPPSAP